MSDLIEASVNNNNTSDQPLSIDASRKPSVSSKSPGAMARRKRLKWITLCVISSVLLASAIVIPTTIRLTKKVASTITRTTTTLLPSPLPPTATTRKTRTSGATITITSTTTISLYLYGVQLNLDPSALPSGWSPFYTTTYATIMNSCVVAKMLTLCRQNKLLLGCRPVKNTILTVAAMGKRADVLCDCSESRNCTHVANDVEWYFSNYYSWGFVRGSDTVFRYTCDNRSGNDAYRLCWQTYSEGGSRCGVRINLHANRAWEKVIYQSN